MSVPTTQILEAAGRALSARDPVSNDEMRDNFEWIWGLERGTFDEHVSSYTDSKLVDVLLDDNWVLIAHSELVNKVYLAAASLPWRFSSKKRVSVQTLYQGRETFEYLALPIDPSSGVKPQSIVSCVPPHLTISYTVDKALRHGNYAWRPFEDIYDTLIKLFGQPSASGATFKLDRSILHSLQFVHEVWAIVMVPHRFLGLEGSDLAASDEGRSDDDTGSSTMEGDAQTLPDEPQRRLFPHELKHDPVLKFWTPAAGDEEDDAISWDSHLTGVDDPEEFAKASMARGNLPDNAWMKGVESWLKSTSGSINDQTLFNDGQIEDRSDEPPRAAASLDLQKPDFWRKCRPVIRA